MKFEDGFCTKEQAARLRELGLAEIGHPSAHFSGPIVTDALQRIWSCAELLDLLPIHRMLPFKGEDWGVLTLHYLHINRYDPNEKYGVPAKWEIEYKHEDGEEYTTAIEIEHEQLAKAAAKMLIYLLENKYMTL